MSEAHILDTLPLPATVAELLAQRKRPIIRSLNDEVEQIHLAIWDEDDGERYRRLLTPIWRTQCIEGSFPMDDSELARIIRDYAKDNRLPIAANSNLQSIVHSLNVVRIRYRLDRRYRQNQVGGQTVTRPNGDEHLGDDIHE